MSAGTPYASASLYVGDLTIDVTEALLFEMFNAVGPVASVRVCRDAASRRSLGYAYVNFHRVDDAERALDTMNFKAICEKPCRIMWSHRDPSLRKSGIGNIFVKNLAKSIDNKSLYDTFSMFGNILSGKVATSTKGESLGYGFVHYETEEASVNAIRRVHGKLISGQRVEIAPFKSRKERGFNRFRFSNVYVKNLPVEWTTADLEAKFGECGKITSAYIPIDETGKSRCFGFANFENPEDAARAVETLNGLDVEDKTLYVVRAQKREEREQELKERFEQFKIERQNKYAGVNLYVKNLTDDIDDDRLEAEFAKFGPITSARIMRDPNGNSKGFGFVCFAQQDGATMAATEMNGRILGNKPLYVALAQRKEVRRAQLVALYAQRQKGVSLSMPQQHGFVGAMPQPGAALYQRQPNFMYPQPMMAPSGGAGGQFGGMPIRPFRLMPMGVSGPPANMPMTQAQPTSSSNSGSNSRGRGRGQRPSGQGRGQQPKNGGSSSRSIDMRVPPSGEPAALDTAALAKALADASESEKKQMIGERLFPLIKAKQPSLAGKIAGMLLEMDNTELLLLLESQTALNEKIAEALDVLRESFIEQGETLQE